MEKELLIPGEAIQKRVSELAQQISLEYRGKEPVLVGILNGVVFFFADLVRKLAIPVKIDFIRAKSYGSQMTSCGSIELVKNIEIPIEGKPVILVEDIVDTGLTLSCIIKELESKRPESLRVCALIDKAERREVAVQVDYLGFHVREGFIVGYGLDYDEEYRQMSDIYVLRKQVD